VTGILLAVAGAMAIVAHTRAEASAVYRWYVLAHAKPVLFR
jgi:hypothetical protein